MSTPHPPSISHDEVTLRLLKGNPEMIRAYIQVVLEEATDAEGLRVLKRAIRHVVRAQGLAETAEKLGLSERSLLRQLTDRGNLSFQTVLAIAQANDSVVTLSPRAPAKKKARRTPATAPSPARPKVKMASQSRSPVG